MISLLLQNMPRSINAILSPRDTLLPLLSPDEAVTLPYSPQLLPGSRDVESPYGTMRLYEWGPKEGRKVLLLHGDTTPAPILGPIAHGLGNRGCRVLVIGEHNTTLVIANSTVLTLFPQISGVEVTRTVLLASSMTLGFLQPKSSLH